MPQWTMSVMNAIVPYLRKIVEHAARNRPRLRRYGNKLQRVALDVFDARGGTLNEVQGLLIVYR